MVVEVLLEGGGATDLYTPLDWQLVFPVRFVVDYLQVLLDTHTITPETVLSKPVMDIPNLNTLQVTDFDFNALREKFSTARSSAKELKKMSTS